jgi:hypothetical protein
MSVFYNTTSQQLTAGKEWELLEVEEIDGKVNWVVREVADSRLNRKKKIVEYLVFWEGYEQEDATREPWEHFRNSTKKALLSFHKPYPRKPRDERVIGLVEAYCLVIMSNFCCYTRFPAFQSFPFGCEFPTSFYVTTSVLVQIAIHLNMNRYQLQWAGHTRGRYCNGTVVLVQAM